MRSLWQIQQGKKCSCEGSDEYCPCQNVSPEQAKQARSTQPDALLDWMTYHHLPLELFREEETEMWVVCDTSRGTVIGSGETTTDALAEARLKELT